MVRKKVKMALIPKDSARKATFKKRKKGLLKKVEELSILCGVDACAIICSPYDNGPELWPNSLGVQNVLARLKNLPEIDQKKNMVTQETYVRRSITKATDKLKKIRRNNREKAIQNVLHDSLVGKGFGGLNTADLTDLCWMADQKIERINRRLEELREPALSNVTQMSSIHQG